MAMVVDDACAADLAAKSKKRNLEVKAKRPNEQSWGREDWLVLVSRN